MGASVVGTTYELSAGGYIFKRKTLNIRTEADSSGNYRFLICRDSNVLRRSDAVYSDESDAWYAGYVLERQLIDSGVLYE